MELALENSELEIKKKSHKGLLYVGLVSVLMAFGGLLSALVVAGGDGNKWFPFEMPFQFTLSVGIIVISSVVLFTATKLFSKGNVKHGVIALAVSFVLGLVFGYSQWLGWGELVASGIHPVRTSQNASFFYVLTVAHLVHVIAGYLVFAVTIRKALKGNYSSDDYLGVQLCGIYWHFLGFLWIVIFMFLAFYS